MSVILKVSTFLTLIVSVLFLGCSQNKESEQSLSQDEKAPIEKTVYAVNTFIAYSGDLSDYLEFGGDVSAESSVDILPEATGRLSNVFISVGDFVRKDQKIAEIDPSRPGMTYSLSPVKAPISGTITSLPASKGSTVSTAMAIGKISDTSSLQIKMNVAERFISKIKLHQTSFLTFDAYPGETFNAVVSSISPVLDTSTRTMGVTLKFSSSDSRLKAGMYARVKLITDTRKSAVIIPSDALISRSNEPYVFIAKNDSVTLQKVVVGIKVDNNVEIISGLSAGDEVVIKGQTLLDDGTLIQVISQVSEGNNSISNFSGSL